MHSGHDERTRAILEQLSKRRVEKETRVEAIPPIIRQLIEQQNARIARLEAVHAALLEEAQRTVNGTN